MVVDLSKFTRLNCDSDLTGKTIKAGEICSSFVALSFTDGSYFWGTFEPSEFDGVILDPKAEVLAFEAYHSLELIDREEWLQLSDAEKDESEAKRIAGDRALYEQLKARFEPATVDVANSATEG